MCSTAAESDAYEYTSKHCLYLCWYIINKTGSVFEQILINIMHL
jgi:hypothetical protein